MKGGVEVTIKEKQELRMSLLKELYDHNEKTGGAEKQVPRNVPMSDEDKEIFLAYEYLDGKRLITFKNFHKSAYKAKITSHGIDYVEEVLNKE